ncbi:MAG: hypothetical protein WBL35_16655, partial [Ornithinibacter sp.]
MLLAPRARSERGNTTAATLGVIAAFIGLVTAVLGLVPALRPWDGAGGTTPTGGPGAASVFLNRDSGPGGAEVLVSGDGFAAGESVVIRFHTEQVGRTTTNGEGRFSNVTVTIPTSFS